VSELVESCRQHDYTDLVVVHEHRGEPDGMVVCHLPYGPTAYFGIFNTVLRHDIGDKKQARRTAGSRCPAAAAWHC
jgi:U3 small nucleolar ribonucleoprotein protein IMP4